MPKSPDDAAYLARLQDYYARWRSLPAYELSLIHISEPTRPY